MATEHKLSDSEVVRAVRQLVGDRDLQPSDFFKRHARCMIWIGDGFRVHVVHPDYPSVPTGYVGAVHTDPFIACMRAWLKVNSSRRP